MTIAAFHHDARTFLDVAYGGRKIARPYGWTCLICKAQRKGYATGEAAKAAAIKHNGGYYR